MPALLPLACRACSPWTWPLPCPLPCSPRSAVASHPVFSIKGWDPTRSAREALLLLKAFLEVRAAWSCLLLRVFLSWRKAAQGFACPARRFMCCLSQHACGAVGLCPTAAPLPPAAHPPAVPCARAWQEHARVDFESGRNASPTAAYLPVEVGGAPVEWEACTDVGLAAAAGEKLLQAGAQASASGGCAACNHPHMRPPPHRRCCWPSWRR